MTRANDFSTLTKTRLAKRAGYKCCYLGCGQGTIGPSREDNDTESSSTGIAAHIYSASFGSGARRKPPIGMPEEMIKHISNGVWMCQTHGKYIDGDEDTFSVEVLRKWKEIGEEVARKMQTFRCDYLTALTEIEHNDPRITEMVLSAQRLDPSKDHYDTLDLLLYRKVLQMIPNSVRLAARQGSFAHRHKAIIREKIDEYLCANENYPVELSFFDKEIQKQKDVMDETLFRLSHYLSLNTFPIKIGEINCFQMSPEWKETIEGGVYYIKISGKIDVLSTSFIKQFDTLHTLCRNKFLE